MPVEVGKAFPIGIDLIRNKVEKPFYRRLCTRYFSSARVASHLMTIRVCWMLFVQSINECDS